MLFASWQLKTTVCILFLTSCLGQELIRACESDYCFERSIESRIPNPNDPRERFRYENLEREELTFLTKDQNRHFARDRQTREDDEQRVDREVRQNHRLADDRRDNAKRTGHQTTSDVIRSIDDRVIERREFSRHFNQLQERADINREGNGHLERRSEDNAGELQQPRERLADRESKRDLSMHSRKGRQERLENSKHLNERASRISPNEARESQRLDRRDSQQEKEHINTLRRFEDRESLRDSNMRLVDYQEAPDEKRRERVVSRRSDNRQQERHDNLRQLNDREENRDLSRRLNSNSGESPDYLRRFHDRKALYDSRRSMDTREELDENRRVQIELLETERRVDGPKDERTIRRLDDSQFNTHKSERDIIRLERNSQRIVKRSFEPKRESRQLRDEYKREQNERNEPSRFSERDFNRRQEDNRKEQHEAMRRFVERGSQRDLSSRKLELLERSDENTRYRERLDNRRESGRQIVPLTRAVDASIQRHVSQEDDSRRLRRLNDYESRLDDESRLSENNRENYRKTLSRFNIHETPLDVGRHLEDTHNSERINGRISQNERESNDHRDAEIRERAEQRNDREAQSDYRRRLQDDHRETLRRFNDHEEQISERSRLDITREERAQLIRQLDERAADISETEKRREQFNDRSSHRDAIRLLEEEDRTNRRVDNKQKSRLSDQRFHREDREQLRREALHLNTEQRSSNESYRKSRFNDANYTEKPTVFLKRGYMVWGQGAILAYVIMKTVNKKDDLKNQLPNNLRTALEILGF